LISINIIFFQNIIYIYSTNKMSLRSGSVISLKTNPHRPFSFFQRFSDVAMTVGGAMVGGSRPHHLLPELPKALLSVGNLGWGCRLQSRSVAIMVFQRHLPRLLQVGADELVCSVARTTLVLLRSVVSRPRSVVSGYLYSQSWWVAVTPLLC